VDELTRQRDSITSHLNQLRQLIGGVAPSMGGNEELTAPPEQPALSSPEPKPAPAAAPAQAKQPVAKAAAPAKGAQAKKSDEDDEDWWQE
jgi:hypothetical protein